MVEGTSFVKWDGVEGVVQFARVVGLGQFEPVEDGGQPGVEVESLTTPIFYDEFGRLEAGRRLLNSLVGGGEVGRGVDMAVWEFRRFNVVSWRSMRSGGHIGGSLG